MYIMPKANKWNDFLREWAKRNNTNFSCAMADPRAKAEYRNPIPHVEKQVKKSRGRPAGSKNKSKSTFEKAGGKEAIGEGILGDIGKAIKKTAYKVGSVAEKTADNVADFTQKVIYGTNDYPAKVRKIIKQVGDEVIVSYTIKRTPVSSLITSALSFVSLGKFGKRFGRLPFDKLFHLFIILTTQSGKRILLEKNEVINMDINPSTKQHEEVKEMVSVPAGLTINELLQKTQQLMGTQKFYGYDASKNNCQDFLLAVLNANKLGDQEDRTFVKQDTKNLFNGLPMLRKFANTMTDIGASVNVLTQGTGHSQLGSQLVGCCAKTGDAICMCDKMATDDPVVGGKININKMVKQVGRYIKRKKGGLASDLITYAIPATTGAIGSAIGVATTGNPVGGVAGSAIGAKLGRMLADDIHDKTGAGLGLGMKKGRLVKGSQEAKDYMRMLREKRG